MMPSRVLNTLFSLIRHQWKIVAVGLLIGAAYFSSWNFRRELGLVQPMANLRYFYFGADPDTFSDCALYWFYYPAYRPYLAYQMIRYGQRYDIHWSDKRDEVLPTSAELGMTDADFR